MVIQRWQTLLLLVAAAVMCCFTFCSLGQVQTPDYTFNFTSMGFSQEGIPTDGKPLLSGSTWYLFVVSLTSAVLLLVDIFLYSNLRLQKKVCLVGIMFVVAAAVTAATLGYSGVEDGSISWSAVIVCPVIALAGAILAYGCMKRDHERLTSVDRIR